jgi:hypothetical protein
MAFNLENMTIDYKKMLRMVPADRATLAQSGQVSDLISSLTPGQLVNLFPRYYRDQLPDIGKSIGSLGGVLSDPSRYVGGGRGGGGGGGDGGGTVPYVPPELSTEKQAEILAKAGIDVTAITGAISAEGLSIDDERVKALRNLSDEEMAKSGLERVTSEDGTTIIKQMAADAQNLSDQEVLSLASGKVSQGTGNLEGIQKTQKQVYDSFVNAGFSDNQAKALTAEVGRENAYQDRYIFGKHVDANNSEVNLGFFSWQGSRGKALLERLNSKGLVDKNGNVVQSQESLNEMAAFAKQEMENIPDYERTKKQFLDNPNISQQEAAEVLGNNFIRWDMAGKKINPGPHIRRRDEYYNQIEQINKDFPGLVPENASPDQIAAARDSLIKQERTQEAEALTRILYKREISAGTSSAQFQGKMGESSAADFYKNVRDQYPEKLDVNSDIWNQVDPELAKARNSIVDAETGLVGRDALLAADASAKVLRKNNYIPRIASGGDNHSENHGSGRDANYSIDMAASVVNDQGKVVPINLGKNMPEQIKNDMATAAHFASVGAEGGHRVGYPDKSSPHSMHIQQDPSRRSAYWGYSETGVETSKLATLQATEEGRRFLQERETISKLTPEQAASYFDSITGFTPKESEVAAEQITAPQPSPVNADPVTSALSRVEGQPSEAIPVPVSPIDPVKIPSDTQQTTTPSAAPAPVANRPEVRSFASGGTVPMTPGENVAGINTDTGKLEFMSNDRELYTKDDQGNLRIDPSTIRQEDQKAEIAPAEPQRQEEPNQPSQRRPEQPMPVSTPDPNFLETMSFGSMASSPSQLRALNRARLYNENSGNLVNGHFS